jgi:hypothetical protein
MNAMRTVLRWGIGGAPEAPAALRRGVRRSILRWVSLLVVGLGGARAAAPAPREPAGGVLFYEGYTFRDNTEAVANPHILGPFFQLYWSEIERQPGEFDWSDWDRRLQPWLAAGKKYALRIMWCSSGNWPLPAAKTPTPAWVWAAGAKYVPYEKSPMEIPLFWDPVYQRYARRFLREVARKFDADARLLFIDITPGAETNPYRFRVINAWSPEFRERYAATPASDGRAYTDALWLETVLASIGASAEVFVRTPRLITLNVGGLNGDRLAEIGAHAVRSGCYVGQNGLSPASLPEGSRRRQLFDGWARQTRLFFEMVDATGETLNSLLAKWGKPPVPVRPGAERNTATLLDYVRAAERLQCSYLNVYAEDVIKGTKGTATYDPAWEEALRHGAAALGRKR